MNWLDRLLKRRDPEEERDKREMVEVHKQFNHAARRALKLESELRRLERAPWKR